MSRKRFRDALVVCTAVAALLFVAAISADTGFLDRSITIGGEIFRYQVYVPVEWRKTQNWPVMIYLHGNGGQGTDGSRQTTEGGVPGLWAEIRNHRERFPLIIVFPQAREDTRWTTPRMQAMVLAQLAATLKEFNGDAKRVYLTGFSMGARGVVRMASRWPGTFAALVATSARSGPGSSRPALEAEDLLAHPFLRETDPYLAFARIVGDTPIWIFHGDADTTVPVQESRLLAAAFKQNGSPQMRYTEYPGLGHVPAYEKSFADPELIRWLLSKHLK